MYDGEVFHWYPPFKDLSPDSAGPDRVPLFWHVRPCLPTFLFFFFHRLGYHSLFAAPGRETVGTASLMLVQHSRSQARLCRCARSLRCFFASLPLPVWRVFFLLLLCQSFFLRPRDVSGLLSSNFFSFMKVYFCLHIRAGMKQYSFPSEPPRRSLRSSIFHYGAL